MKVYERSKSWPKEELYGLTSQCRRAGVSVAANIAEGNGREITKEYLHFLATAYGSLMEVDTHLEFARRCGCLSDEEVDSALALLPRCAKLLSGLRGALQRKIRSQSPTSNP